MDLETDINYQFYFEGHTKLISRLAITPNSKYLISTSNDKTIRI